MKKYIFLFILLAAISKIPFAQDILKATNGAMITVTSGANLFVNGGISLDNNSKLNNSGIVTIAAQGSATADFADNTSTPYNYGTGEFVFEGTGSQTISSPNQFATIAVNDAGLNFASSVTTNNWYLQSGKVNTGAFIAIANSTDATAVQADPSNPNFSNSWINGNLRRFISPSTIDSYQFPIGDANKVNIAEMDNLTANPLTGVTYVTASFGSKPGDDAGLNVSEGGTSYTSVNTGGVWYLVPDANPGSGKYNLKLFFNGFTGLSDNSFGILRRPDASSNAADWIVPAGSVLPTSGSPGRTVAGGFAQRNNISTFSQLGIGITQSALPLQLISFYAVKKDKDVLLQWVTANEFNTDRFEIYKGGQNMALNYLDKVAAAGSSNTNLTYNYTDNKPLDGLNFYQLKMVDKDGKFQLSQIVNVDFEGNSSISVYPNPVTNHTLFVNYSGAKIREVKVFASDGKGVQSNFEIVNQNQVKVTLPVLAKGVYTLSLVTDKGLKNVMIEVQ